MGDADSDRSAIPSEPGLSEATDGAGSLRRPARKLTLREQKQRKLRNKRRRERYRLDKLLEVEEEYWQRGLEHVAGVDEAGRGPLAGPVFAAAVIMPRGVAVAGVKDSKLLSPEARLALASVIRERALCIGVGAASAREIDRLNILRATHLAMCRAVARLRVRPDHILVDGLPVAALGPGHTAIVDADASVHAVACASVLAKTLRDFLMHRLAVRYPGYGWEHNVGYGTAEHRGAIDLLGMTPHHRRSFRDMQLALELDLGGPA